MIPRNWRKAEEYDFCDRLTREQWAWEFLRRHPEYQRQWHEFMDTWRALEAEYGRPPNRDFCAWKNDPRAWVPAAECPDGECRVDGQKVLIECAMGARWGFHKFPPDPADDDPVGAGRLSWRPRVPHPLPEVEQDEDLPQGLEEIALKFDLSMPLKPQLEQARRQLQKALAARRRQGLQRKRISRLAPAWKRLLRYLDAQAVGETQAFCAELASEECRALATAVERMLAGGYLEILDLPP